MHLVRWLRRGSETLPLRIILCIVNIKIPSPLFPVIINVAVNLVDGVGFYPTFASEARGGFVCVIAVF